MSPAFPFTAAGDYSDADSDPLSLRSLPTSIQGGSQAIEDGATLAQTLWLAGGTKKDVPLALQTYQEIRYARTVRTQKLGVE